MFYHSAHLPQRHGTKIYYVKDIESAGSTKPTTATILSEPPVQVEAGVETATDPPSFDKFHVFPNLPPELRLQIWRALPGPRIVLVRRYGDSFRVHPLTGARLTQHLYDSPSKPLVILFACRESGAEALRFYEHRFGFGHALLPTVYFNFNINTLYFDSIGSLFSFLPDCYKGEPRQEHFRHNIERVERVAFDYKYYTRPSDPRTSLMLNLRLRADAK